MVVGAYYRLLAPRVVLEWYLVCVPFIENTECVRQDLRTECVCQLQSIDTQGRLELELAPSVCALFGSYRMCVLGFEKTVCANFRLPAPRVVCSITLYPSLPLSQQLLFTANLLSS